jgi:hypothetical protein
MNVKVMLSTAAVAALVLGNGVMMHSQEAGTLAAQEDAMARSDERAQDDNLAEGDETTRSTVFPSLTLFSRNNVEVWRLTCTTTPIGVVQTARARLRDRGGADGRRLYFHLTRTTTGATVKNTAPDGGLSTFVSVGSGGAGSTYWIGISKDRDAQVVGPFVIAEPFTLEAQCIAGGIVRPHVLALVPGQNR